MTEKPLTHILLESSAIREENDIKQLSDLDLALAKVKYQPGSAEHFLIEQECTRRMISHQIAEQYKLDERLAKTTRWWGLASALIGVAGTLAGSFIGYFLSERSDPKTLTDQVGVQAISKTQGSEPTLAIKKPELPIATSAPHPFATAASK